MTMNLFEVARYLGITPRQVYWWTTVPFPTEPLPMDPGGVVEFDDLLAWMHLSNIEVPARNPAQLTFDDLA